MELAYVCEWEKRPKCTHCPSIPLVCSWSCRNLVAFTTDLKNDDEDKGKWQHGVTNFSCFRLLAHQCWLFDTARCPLAFDTTLMCHIHVAQQCHYFLFFLNFQNSSPSHASSFVNCERQGFKWFKSNDHTLCVLCDCACLYVRPPAPCSSTPGTHTSQIIRTLRGKYARAQHDCLLWVSLWSMCRK